jgi:hypothetical protein
MTSLHVMHDPVPTAAWLSSDVARAAGASSAGRRRFESSADAILRSASLPLEWTMPAKNAEISERYEKR